MAIGERIHFFRTMGGMTQKYFGMKAGFSERTADIRIAQYESETRVPKEDMVNTFAGILEVNPKALTIPDIDTYIGLMHTLFTLEDRYGLTADIDDDGSVVFKINRSQSVQADAFYKEAECWAKISHQYKNGEIDKDTYDQFRYTYPEQNPDYRHIPQLSPDLEKQLLKAAKKALKE